MLLSPANAQPSPPGDSVPTGPHSQAVQGRALPLVTGKVSNLDKLYWEEWSVARAAKQHQAQLLHMPYLIAPMPLPGVKSCPVVVTAHDMIPWVVPGYSGSRATRLYFALAAASVRRADLILADSAASRLDVIRVLTMPPRRVRMIYLGMEQHPQYSPQELQEVRARHNLPEQYAFYLGGFDLRKNVPLLLRAWQAASEALYRETGERPLLAIGGSVPAPGGVNPDVSGDAKRLGMAGPGAPLRFLGRVSEEDKPLLMAAARLFVYPSAYEGFGLDPFEAMSVGCPVVSSSGGSLQEVVDDAGLLVPPGDEQAMVKVILYAWEDPALRATLSRKGRERARQFTWQRTAKQTRALYGAVIGRRNARLKT